MGKPADAAQRSYALNLPTYQFTHLPIHQLTNLFLPVFVLRAVERRAVELRVNVEDVLAAPARRVGLVLVRAHSPLGRVRHRIDGDLAEELELASRRVV